MFLTIQMESGVWPENKEGSTYTLHLFQKEGESFLANYHFEVSIISRGKGRSVTGAVSYICGRKLHDKYRNQTYRNPRKDVVWQKVFLPADVPQKYGEFQYLCDEIERAETRWDARTARLFIGSLPNELSPGELVRIVHEFIDSNFVSQNLCVIAAIHRGYNAESPSHNNPHVHIIVPTRTIGADGFSKRKDREHDKKRYMDIWREQWADVQNRAYERNQMDIRVSHESLAAQGKRNREPTIHLSRIDWQREQRGERTLAGDRKRKIQEHNREKDARRWEMELSR